MADCRMPYPETSPCVHLLQLGVSNFRTENGERCPNQSRYRHSQTLRQGWECRFRISGYSKSLDLTVVAERYAPGKTMLRSRNRTGNEGAVIGTGGMVDSPIVDFPAQWMRVEACIWHCEWLVL